MVSLCIQLGTMNFCNIKQLKTRIRRYLQTILLLLQVSPPPPGCACPNSVHLPPAWQRREALFKKHSISNTVTTTDISHETW